MRKRPLLLLACVFLTGLVFQRYSIGLLIAVIAIAIIWECLKGRQSKKFWKTAGRSLILLSAFLIGILHMQQEMDFRAAYMSKIADGSRITVWGKLIKLETTDYGNRGILSDCYLDFGEGTLPCNDVMVYTSTDQYEIGQIHKITGKVNMFSRARNEGNFDSLVYYQSLKIDFAMDAESSVVLGNELQAGETFLLSLREQMCEVYQSCLSEKAAGFYQAMVLGNKTELDEHLKDLFLLGGISHILAISGLHVSILGRGMYRVLRKGGISFGVAGICGSILLISYCIMVGSSASTVRAVGMMLFSFLAQWMGRSYDMLNALGGMVLFLLWENPFLIENSGFWFSVTALMGVGVVGNAFSSRIVDENEKKTKKRRAFDWSGLWMSLGITLATMPVTALSYFEVPMYSVLVNYVVLPVLTPIFCLAVVGALLGTCGLPQGVTAFVLTPCEWMLAFYEWVCDIVSRLPGTTVICGKPWWWQVVVYYTILLIVVCFIQNLKNEERNIISKQSVVRVAIFCVCGLCIFFPKSKAFEITFLDVGQGDGIYISAGDGTTYFIDGGSSSVDGVGEYRILPFLKAKDVSSIDYWFVSHCDMDHIAGLLEIIEKGYKIKHIVLHERSSSNEVNISLVELAAEKGIKVIEMKAGDRICSEKMEITCLAPTMEGDVSVSVDANESSMVLQLEYKGAKETEEFRALFAGDISTEMENALCKSGVLEDVDLVKANHHGSNYSNGELWFEVLSPEYIVVSCSATNLYGHPGVKAVKRMKESGAQILYTMENGQVKFEIKEGVISVYGK